MNEPRKLPGFQQSLEGPTGDQTIWTALIVRQPRVSGAPQLGFCLPYAGSVFRLASTCLWAAYSVYYRWLEFGCFRLGSFSFLKMY